MLGVSNVHLGQGDTKLMVLFGELLERGHVSPNGKVVNAKLGASLRAMLHDMLHLSRRFDANGDGFFFFCDTMDKFKCPLATSTPTSRSASSKSWPSSSSAAPDTASTSTT